MRGRRAVLAFVAMGSVLAAGCRGGGEGRYEFFLLGNVMFRCHRDTGECVAGRAGEAAAYAVLPPAGQTLEEWAAEEGLAVGVEGR